MPNQLSKTKYYPDSLASVKVQSELRVTIYLVNGKYVREHYNIDWTMGGHYYRWPFTPKNEIWIDQDLNFEDCEATVWHELREYDKMKNYGWSYETAHEYALDEEREFRLLQNLMIIDSETWDALNIPSGDIDSDPNLKKEYYSELTKKIKELGEINITNFILAELENENYHSLLEFLKRNPDLLAKPEKTDEKKGTINVGDIIEVQYGGKIINTKVTRLKRDSFTWQGKTEDRSIYYILPPDRENKPGAEIGYEASLVKLFGLNELKGGKADNKTIADIAKEQNVSKEFALEQLLKGINVESEHTNDIEKQQEIAMDHLTESINYYIELEKMENKLEKDKIKLPENLVGKELDASDIKKEYLKKSKPSKKADIEEIVNKSTLTESDKEILYNWEGEGYEKSGTSKTGILHEFFTPYWLCLAISDIVKELGIITDKVLDPAAGTGRLIRYVNAKSAILFERNSFNAKIAEKLYPMAKVYIQDFETSLLKEPRFNSLAKTSWLGNDFDLVISNPPYGEYSGEYKIYMPKIFTRFESLFIYLTLGNLKSGGYGIYILPQSFMNNGNMYNAQKAKIMELANFIDAVRLPNKIFTSTDIGVDILILQKK